MCFPFKRYVFYFFSTWKCACSLTHPRSPDWVRPWSQMEQEQHVSLAAAPGSLAPLTSVLVVLRSGAGAQFGALPHVVTAISSFLDHALPSIWSLVRACEYNLLSLLRRLDARGGLPGDDSSIDPFYWVSQCSKGLVLAVKNDNLEMAAWLHDHYPSVLPYTALIEAARTGICVCCSGCWPNTRASSCGSCT